MLRRAIRLASKAESSKEAMGAAQKAAREASQRQRSGEKGWQQQQPGSGMGYSNDVTPTDPSGGIIVKAGAAAALAFVCYKIATSLSITPKDVSSPVLSKRERMREQRLQRTKEWRSNFDDKAQAEAAEFMKEYSRECKLMDDWNAAWRSQYKENKGRYRWVDALAFTRDMDKLADRGTLARANAEEMGVAIPEGFPLHPTMTGQSTLKVDMQHKSVGPRYRNFLEEVTSQAKASLAAGASQGIADLGEDEVVAEVTPRQGFNADNLESSKPSV